MPWLTRICDACHELIDSFCGDVTVMTFQGYYHERCLDEQHKPIKTNRERKNENVTNEKENKQG